MGTGTTGIGALAIATCATIWSLAPAGATEPPRYDLIIRHGIIFDGSGAPGKLADIAINGDRIVRIGNLDDAKGTIEEDARGLYVTPGFISVHDHTLTKAYTTAESLLTQGITTAITNADGRGSVNIREQLGSADRGLSLNFGAYIGFNAVWQHVMGLGNKRPSPADLARMRGIVEANLERGAWGLSAGLDYKPAYWATTAEVIEVAKAAGRWRTNFPNHERLSDENGKSSLAGIAETLSIGEAAELMPVVTHVKLQGKDRGKTPELFGSLQDAIDRGHDVGADAYAYTYGFTSSIAQLLFPAWAQEGGRDSTLARLKDAKLRANIAAGIEQEITERWNGVDNVFLPLTRQKLSEYMAAQGGMAPGEAVIRIYEERDQPVILHFGLEKDLLAILKHPLVAISCDCGSLMVDYGHPRYWGAFPRFLGRYVREQKIVSWGEAVRKMTTLPAAMIGLTERGYLLPGMIADITIFDPATVADRATVEQPVLPSVGIRSVIINGRHALRDGRVTGQLPGQALFRSAHMPSRPMSFDVARSAAGRGTITREGSADRLRVRFNISQGANAARPKGMFSLVDEAGKAVLEMKAPSIIQTSANWASITGIGHSAEGQDKPVTVIVEEADPFAGGKPTISIAVAGAPFASGVVEAGAVDVEQAARNPRAVTVAR